MYKNALIFYLYERKLRNKIYKYIYKINIFICIIKFKYS